MVKKQAQECPGRVNPRLFWWRKAGLTAKNPRRHPAGKPFHAFLIGWLGKASPRSDSWKRIWINLTEETDGKN
jgi:hypothetical protein